ncbi:hypothetical protein K435DRAFT_926651 [Dendrothele bispora CBS 962.96]|uniref:G-protein coupled receptors family 1 profile domain-containing protein n=1 Tax=Dendrothele bispora (strain CBS 962.96) TaxID=1314807 RepID=A0A4S8L8U1_DENBC|nr:hypothetical protein K435DRAFT_926651 [Dendrothele bispora CBS 962.96]
MSSSFLSHQIAAFVLTSFTYGIFVVLWIISIVLMINRLITTTTTRPYSRSFPYGSIAYMALRRPLIISIILLFLFNTGQWIIVFIRILKAFGEIPDASWPTRFLSNFAEPTEVAYAIVATTSIFTSDCIIVYRLWCIWNCQSLVIIFPILSTASLLACSIGMAHQYTLFRPGDNIFAATSGRWMLSVCVLTLTTNGYSTGFIAWRVSRVHKQVAHMKLNNFSLSKVLMIFVESAALYMLWALAVIVAYGLRSTVFVTIIHVGPPIAGIACCMISIRIGLGWAQGSSPKVSTHTSSQIPVSIGSSRTAPVQPLEIAMDIVRSNDSGESGTNIKPEGRIIAN